VLMFQRRTRVEPSLSTHLSWPSLSENRMRVPCGVRERIFEREAEARLRVGGLASVASDEEGGVRGYNSREPLPLYSPPATSVGLFGVGRELIEQRLPPLWIVETIFGKKRRS